MADRPIIFSAPMIRALLDGRKTQTRRIIKPSPEFCGGGRSRDPQNWNDPDAWGWENYDEGCWDLLSEGYTGRPFYAPGDRLWVREAWRIGAWDWNNAQIAVDYCDGPRKEWLAVDDGDMLHRLIDQSRADAVKAGLPLRYSYYEYSWSPGHSPCRWRSPIHMPRWASRLTLLVTDVRVQRLQEISEADAKAEGVGGVCWEDWRDYGGPSSYRLPFRSLWNSIHGHDAWDDNPWVAALTFTVHRCNIDKMEEGTW